jgi:hypothetical protein
MYKVRIGMEMTAWEGMMDLKLWENGKGCYA